MDHPDQFNREDSMFAIGDEEWPGLSKLAEECGEVIQVIGKLMGTRGKTDHWDGMDLRKRLIEELADLIAAICFAVDQNRLDEQALKERIEKKLETFERWHNEQDPC
jgi:NTP pyrophosphatase (non-canonical NTP hydrolase)